MHCVQCEGVFRDPTEFPGEKEEKERYLSHNNDLADRRYLNFLKKLTTTLYPFLSPGMKGLDFGCGPVKAMEYLFTHEEGLRELMATIESYDPYFFPVPCMAPQRYDFILASEVVEHLFDPSRAFEAFREWLRPGGLLAIMTQTRKEERDFLSWSYRRDPTHVFFFHEKTLQWVSQHYGLSLIKNDINQFIFKRPEEE